MSERDKIQICGSDSCGTSPAVYDEQRSRGSTSRQVRIDVVSDAICPWCYVAKRHLATAIGKLSETHDVSVRWLPFQLNPTMPKGGLDRRQYRSSKFGSWEHSKRLEEQVAHAGRQAGLDFHHERMERTPNTFDAHRLIWLAGTTGVQDDMVERLFDAYFVLGRDIGNRDVLNDIALAAGKAKLEAFWRDEGGSEEVKAEEARAKSLGISGVPTVLVNSGPVFSGALPPDLMLGKILDAIGKPQGERQSPRPLPA